MKEYNLCPVCGGIKREGAYPRLMHGLCSCAEKSMSNPKHHAGEIGHQPVYTIRYLKGTPDIKLSGIAIAGPAGTLAFRPDEALSLLAWLTQEKPTLERLAKEQERG